MKLAGFALREKLVSEPQRECCKRCPKLRG